MEKNYAEQPYPTKSGEGMGYGPPSHQNPPGYMPVSQGPPGPPGMPQQQEMYPPGPPPPPGYQPYPNQGVQYNQQYPNTVIVQQPGIIVAAPPPNVQEPNENLTLYAVLVCLCCFWPTGICAILKAREARSAWDGGNYVFAADQASTAKKLIIASLILGVICISLSVGLKVYQSYRYYG